jgi:hypothetical protein
LNREQFVYTTSASTFITSQGERRKAFDDEWHGEAEAEAFFCHYHENELFLPPLKLDEASFYLHLMHFSCFPNGNGLMKCLCSGCD